MLKPRKCRKALLILSPRLKVAIGKKLFLVNGPWAAQQFQMYSNRTMLTAMKDTHGVSTRPRPEQLGMVARKLGSVYRRHMEKIFAPGPKVDWGMVKEMDFTRKEPTAAGGHFPMSRFGWSGVGATRSDAFDKVIGLCMNGVDFNYHNHIPKADQKHYFATPEHVTLTGRPAGTIVSNSMNDYLLSQPRQKVLEGEVLSPELEIKGVHLKQSKLSRERIEELVEEFGTIAEKQLIERFYADTGIVNPDDEEAVQRAARRCLFKE